MDDHIIKLYTEYIKTTSSMAPSLKTLELLKNLCLPFCTVLDLGSGFSSYYLRYYSGQQNWGITTVDDNADWLNKSKDYCNSHNTNINGFYTWDNIKNQYWLYDVVFMDLGITKNRPKYIETVLINFCSPKTLILFDDMHKPTIRQATEQALSKYDYLEIGVKDQTMDEFGRYCKLVFRLRRKSID